MGVTTRREMQDFATTVVVRSPCLDGRDIVKYVQTTIALTPTITHILAPSYLKRDDDLEDDDDGDNDRNEEQPSVVTMTVPMSAPTGTAVSNSDPIESVTVDRPRPDKSGMGLSETTHHLLIAAGSIGATIILVMVILAVYTMRKRNLTLTEVLALGKSRMTRRKAPQSPPKIAGWDSKQAYSVDYRSVMKDAVTVAPPERAMSLRRSESGSSQRPLMAIQTSESFNTRLPPQLSPQKTFLLDSPPPKHTRSHRRNQSETPSSPLILPLQTQRRQSDFHRHTSSTEASSELRYPQTPKDRGLSALPPPPTFKQFLNNRPNISARMKTTANAVSRFSWTNSNAPQTPHDTAGDANVYSHGVVHVGRDSYMTQRSSVPRFRTIDSWVDQQAGRFEEAKLRDQFRVMNTTATGRTEDMGEGDRIPDVPEIPSEITARTPLASKPLLLPTAGAATTPTTTTTTTTTPRSPTLSPATAEAATPNKDSQQVPQHLPMAKYEPAEQAPVEKPAQPLLPPLPLPLTPIVSTATATLQSPPPQALPPRIHNVKHERQDTNMTVKTASIFRAHPGTEVRFSTRSAVPSEILDAGMGKKTRMRVLSRESL